MDASPIKESRWMTVNEVAEYLRVEPGTIRQWVKFRRIPYGKARTLTRFDREQIDAWVRGELTDPAA
ncbi:MAG: helix-turn-helix domain-containing protein [Gemmatimonadota bacterium]|jgi:excisionase family DNA binding protein|nr:helix-turn-helix domain-containing protein [Gemmatimonadota bacterium]